MCLSCAKNLRLDITQIIIIFIIIIEIGCCYVAQAGLELTAVLLQPKFLGLWVRVTLHAWLWCSDEFCVMSSFSRILGSCTQAIFRADLLTCTEPLQTTFLFFMSSQF